MLKLTKHALRAEQVKLTQLERYLPTLHLKKALLQSEVGTMRLELKRLQERSNRARFNVSSVSSLFTDYSPIAAEQLACIRKIHTKLENIAGVELPVYERVEFIDPDYSLFMTPAWVDGATQLLRLWLEERAQITVAEQRLTALETELRQITIRVNLFEKNLIPKAEKNIRKIKVFLGDQELAAIAQAKVAKAKIEAKKEANRAS